MQRIFFILFYLPFFTIAQEINFEFKPYKVNASSFFISSNDPFDFKRFASKKPLFNTKLIGSKGKKINVYNFEVKNLYRPNTVSVYQTSKFETPQVENLAAELFIGFLYELCRVIDNPQPLFCP